MPLTPERIEEIRKRLEGITPFPWMAGHLADDTSSCNCTSVLSDSYAGAVCTVEPNNGKRISDGGNDGAPLEEAKANLRFIAHAPQDISDLLSAYDALSREREALVKAGCCSSKEIPMATRPASTASLVNLKTAHSALQTLYAWDLGEAADMLVQQAFNAVTSVLVEETGPSPFPDLGNTPTQGGSNAIKQTDAALSPDAPRQKVE